MLTWQISAGELGTSVEKLEAQLPLIFQRADKWKAVLLLDEADVFLEQRSLLTVESTGFTGKTNRFGCLGLRKTLKLSILPMQIY